jgi:hypothetical protein
MAQADSSRPDIAGSLIRARVSPSRICGGQCGTGIGFSLCSSVFSC